MRQDLKYNFVVHYRDGQVLKQFEPCKIGCGQDPCLNCHENKWADIDKTKVSHFDVVDAPWNISQEKEQPMVVRLRVWIPPGGKLIFRRIWIKNPSEGRVCSWMVGCQTVDTKYISILHDDGIVEIADHFIEMRKNDRNQLVKVDPQEILPHWFQEPLISPTDNEAWDGLKNSY